MKLPAATWIKARKLGNAGAAFFRWLGPRATALRAPAEWQALYSAFLAEPVKE